MLHWWCPEKEAQTMLVKLTGKIAKTEENSDNYLSKDLNASRKIIEPTPVFDLAGLYLNERRNLL